MNQDLIQQLEPQYRDLQHYIDLLSKGECKVTDVKHRSALLGIYREKDETYMCRVRRNCGRVFIKNLHDLADIMDANQIDHAHFSTRQNIQLHGVPSKNVHQTIKACNAADMLFRGGGGNTFRSIATSPYSGVSPTEAFDSIPHAEAVWNWISTYERAYGFGRKFKMGISSEPSDDINAGIQDIGFVAKIRNKERGFKVYCGGGMGRDPGLGIVISDFLPEKDIIRVVQAAVDLFFENGNRKVRPKARLRFVLQEMGPDVFKGLFYQYMEETDAPDYLHQSNKYAVQINPQKTEDSTPSPDFQQWAKRSVKQTSHGDGIKSVCLYVRDGNFNADQLRRLAVLLEELGIQEIRAASSQNIIIPLIQESKLPELYNALKKKCADVISVESDFSGQIISCIGATNCPIGLLPTENTRAHIALALNDLIKNYPEISSDVYESIINGINISGCASSCGLNLISAIGFHGHKKRIDGEVIEYYQLHLGGQINEEDHMLAHTNAEWLIKADEIEIVASALVQSYLNHVQTHGGISLRRFMISKRSSFSSLTEFSINKLVQIIEE